MTLHHLNVRNVFCLRLYELYYEPAHSLPAHAITEFTVMNNVVTTSHGRTRKEGAQHCSQPDFQVDSELMTLAVSVTGIWCEK